MRSIILTIANIDGLLLTASLPDALGIADLPAVRVHPGLMVGSDSPCAVLGQ
jgi:hypothetical protein